MGDPDSGGEVSVSPARARDPLVLALDVGSSSVRAIVYDSRGRAVQGWEFHRPYENTTTLDGGVTADPDDLVDSSAACVDAVLALMDEAQRRPAAVACDTFWHSLMALDGQGRPITPVLTWADTRSAAEAMELRRRLDERAIHERTGTFLHSSYPPAKLLWVQRNQPDVFRRAASWMSLGEYLYLRLFGERRVSISMASGSGLFDQNDCRWDAEMLEAVGVREEQLSEIADYTAILSGLRPDFANRWPGTSGIPWYLPLGDGACSNVGSGGTTDVTAVLMVGTSGAIRVVREARRSRVPAGLWTYRVDLRRFVQGGALSAGGNVFDWASRVFQLGDARALEEQILSASPDAHGLTVLPFLAGERSPDWNVDARSAIVGMTLHTRPVDILQALLESVAYRFGVVLELLQQAVPTARAIIGSGAGLVHSPAWMQMMTDVLGQSMAVSAVPEATTRGAALLALEAMGAVSTPVPAPLGASYRPRPMHTSIYRRAMQRQEELYKRLTS